MRVLSLLAILLLASGAVRAAEPALTEEFTAQRKLVTDAIAAGELEVAERLLTRFVELPSSDESKREALLAIGEAYAHTKSPQYAKSIAVYEKVVLLFPSDQTTPATCLRLGRLYRESGAYEMAIKRFYNVVNFALRIPNDEINAYRQLTVTAQNEIADTYFAMGDYQQAARFYRLVKLLDLSAEERARLQYRSTYCIFLLADYPAALKSAEDFLREFPDHASAPECRYIMASALRCLNRNKESFEQVLTLLRHEHGKQAKDGGAWIYWQKKTGNQFANDFYQQGDFLSALTIYQTLATLNNQPDWQWPVVYQMGLCFERLRFEPRAAEAYHFIVTEAAKPQLDNLAAPLASLRDMAQWRSEQLAWNQKTEEDLKSLLGEVSPPSTLATP